MHLAAATAATATATATATAPSRAKRDTLSREEQAKKSVLLAKSSGYERRAAAQRSNAEMDHDFDPHVVKMQDGILRIYVE
jgi:hypothetical protein